MRAELLVEEEVRRFEQRAQTAEVVPTIVSLQQHLETLRQAELDRVRGRLGTLSPEQEMAVEALTRGIINKIMHTPITTLKSAARDPESTTVVDVVRKLFNLRAESDPRLRRRLVSSSAARRTPCRQCPCPSACARSAPEQAVGRGSGLAVVHKSKSEISKGSSGMALLRIGSRGSQLALWQAHHISALLREQGHQVELEIIKTTGDKITDVALAKVGTKGMFTKEIEEALKPRAASILPCTASRTCPPAGRPL